MKKYKKPKNQKLLHSILDLIKSDNGASKTTLSEVLGVSRMAIHRGILKLKEDKIIKAKDKRVGIVEQYEILKKD